MIKKTVGEMRLILVDDLSPEDDAMFQALYARSAAGAEKILEDVYLERRKALMSAMKSDDRQDVFLDGHERAMAADVAMDVWSDNNSTTRAKRLHAQYTAKYGHKSIADCGSTTLCVESCSMLAAKAIQDWPLYSGQETSTRAINMSTQRIVDPFNTPESQAILDRWMSFYREAQGPVEAEVRRRYPRQDGMPCRNCRGQCYIEGPCLVCFDKPPADAEDEKAYEGAVKYRVFDILRAFLPAGATTNVSWHTNLRQAGDHLTWLLHHPLEEVRQIAEGWQAMLRERYPSSGSFGGAAGLSGVAMDEHDVERAVWYESAAKTLTYPPDYYADWRHHDTISIPSWDVDAREAVRTRPRGCVLPHYMTDFGQVSFTFTLDFGSFRDLQRHRNGVCRMPKLVSFAGLFEPWYLEQLPADFRVRAEALIREHFREIHRHFKHSDRPLDAQYLLAMGYPVQCHVTMGLPSFVYLVELRSTKSVHPTLRNVIRRMITSFQKKHPDIPLHVDMTPDPWNVRRGTQTIERREEIK